jgi:hypothetical protein
LLSDCQQLNEMWASFIAKNVAQKIKFLILGWKGSPNTAVF